MPIKQKFAVVFVIILFLMFVFNLVRTRKLREAYSAFWLFAGIGMLVLVIRYDWLVALTRFMGIVLPTSTIFMLGIMVILAVEVQVTGVLTRHHDTIQQLVQEIGLLSREVENLKNQINAETPGNNQKNMQKNNSK